MRYLIYDINTGEITQALVCSPNSIHLNIQDNESYIESDKSYDEYYMYVGSGEHTLISRPRFQDRSNKSGLNIMNDGIDIFSYGPNLPIGTMAIIIYNSPEADPTIQSITIDDGTLEITSIVKMIIGIELILYPYQNEQFSIIVDGA